MIIELYLFKVIDLDHFIFVLSILLFLFFECVFYGTLHITNNLRFIYSLPSGIAKSTMCLTCCTLYHTYYILIPHLFNIHIYRSLLYVSYVWY